MRYIHILLLIVLLAGSIALNNEGADKSLQESSINSRKRPSTKYSLTELSKDDSVKVINPTYHIRPDSSNRATCSGNWYGDPTAVINGWFDGDELYAAYQDPSLVDCPDAYPFEVVSVKWHVFNNYPELLYFDIQPVIFENDGDTLCPVPGAVLYSGPTYIIGLPGTGSYILELPFQETVCVNGPYFAGFYVPTYLGYNIDDIGLVIDDAPSICTIYNDWGMNWTDLFTYFPGDVLIWSEGISSDENPCPPIITANVLNVIPSQNQINVPADTDISVVFDSSISTATLNDSSFIIHASQTGLHPGTITYDDPSWTATFNPDGNFAFGEVVTVVLTDGIENVGGDPLKPFSWSFTVTAEEGPYHFGVREDIYSGDGPNAVIAFDCDSDGILDLAASNDGDATISVFRGMGNGVFDPAVTYPAGSGALRVTSADLDRDGFPDLIAADNDTNTITILINNGNGTFADMVAFEIGMNPNAVCLIDVENDGDIDLAVVNANNTMAICRNNGSGQISGSTVYSTGNNPVYVTSADFNNDGYMDIAVACKDDNSITIHLNNQFGWFFIDNSYSVGSMPYDCRTADFNADGFMDISVANFGADTTTVLLNNGDGTFYLGAVVPVIDYSRGISNSDIDGDGDMDIITAHSYQDYIRIWENDGIGNFIYSKGFNVGNYPYGTLMVDLDGDGDLDIATANYYSDNITLLFNKIYYPPGNHCENPIVINTSTDLPYVSYNDSTVGRVNYYENTCLYPSDGGEDVIYQLIVETSINIDIVMDPHSSMNSAIGLSSECPLAGGPSDDCLAESHRFNDNTPHELNGIFLQPGSYYIMIDNQPPPYSIDTFDLFIHEHVYTTGDYCDDPIIIHTSTDLPFVSNNETTCGRINDYENTCLGDYDENEDIIYEIVLESQMALKITMDPLGSSYTGIALVIDCPPTGADYSDCIEESHNHTASNPHILTSPLLNPKSYYLIIDNHDLSGTSCIGSFNLTVEEYIIPSGENCSSPIFINTSELPFESYYETTCGKINDYFNTCMDDFDEGEDIIYEFIVDTTVTVDIIMDPLGTSNTAVGIADACPFHDPEVDDCTLESKHSDATPHILNDIELFPGETYYLMIDSWDSGSCIPAFNLIIKPSGSPDMAEIRTDCIRIAWNSAGNIGIAGYNGYGGFNMGFTDDCDTTDNTQFSNDNASKYLYESSPFVLRVNETEDTLLSDYMFRDDWLSPNGFRPLGNPVSDSTTYSDYNYGATGDFVTQDSAISILVEYFAPKDPDSCESIVLRETFVNISGDSLFDVFFGDLFDWDIPSDVSVRNGSGFIKGGGGTSLDLMYCYGAEYGPDENENDDCVLADQRLGGVSFYNGYRLPAGCPATDSIENPSGSWWTGSNSEWIGPLGGWDGSQLYQKMESMGSTWETYESLNPGSDYVDLNMVATFGRYDLGINDSLVFIKIMVSTTAGLSGINSAVNKGTAWVENRPQIFTWPAFNDDECVSCCDLPGDASDNGAVNILDITFLIAYLYKGGPEPNCLYEGDADGNETINILDITRLIAFLYKGGPEPECP